MDEKWTYRYERDTEFPRVDEVSLKNCRHVVRNFVGGDTAEGDGQHSRHAYSGMIR